MAKLGVSHTQAGCAQLNVRLAKCFGALCVAIARTFACHAMIALNTTDGGPSCHSSDFWPAWPNTNGGCMQPSLSNTTSNPGIIILRFIALGCFTSDINLSALLKATASTHCVHVLICSLQCVAVYFGPLSLHACAGRATE